MFCRPFSVSYCFSTVASVATLSPLSSPRISWCNAELSLLCRKMQQTFNFYFACFVLFWFPFWSRSFFPCIQVISLYHYATCFNCGNNPSQFNQNNQEGNATWQSDWGRVAKHRKCIRSRTTYEVACIGFEKLVFVLFILSLKTGYGSHLLAVCT